MYTAQCTCYSSATALCPVHSHIYPDWMSPKTPIETYRRTGILPIEPARHLEINISDELSKDIERNIDYRRIMQRELERQMGIDRNRLAYDRFMDALFPTEQSWIPFL